jgi:muramoyltetrapeptide carboxypeptidase
LNVTRKPTVKPGALNPGDTLGIIAPASPIERDQFEAGCVALRSLGYELVFLDSIFDQQRYFSGSLRRRVDEFNAMWARPDVKGIVCARGGYGCNYLLPEIDIDVIAASPKIFVGYSDVTSLLTYITDATGLVTFHGPMVAKDFALSGGVDAANWQETLSGEPAQMIFTSGSEVAPLIRGYGRGRLYGGCLSMLAASMGTPYEIKTDGTILFVEDIGTKPYQVDRMLMQLKLGGKLDGVRGILFGQMVDCEPGPGSDYTIRDVVASIAGDLSIPVAYGFRSGHVHGGNITVPIGVEATLQVQDEEVRLAWQPAVTTERAKRAWEKV